MRPTGLGVVRRHRETVDGLAHLHSSQPTNFQARPPRRQRRVEWEFGRDVDSMRRCAYRSTSLNQNSPRSSTHLSLPPYKVNRRRTIVTAHSGQVDGHASVSLCKTP